MSDSNDKTLQAYEAHVAEYVAGTVQTVDGHIKEWIDAATALIPRGGTILELGSAFGRDANYLESQGFKVERTDATRAFVELLQNEGHQARVLNAITDDLGGPYDMVFADAVLLHFTREEFAATVRKIYAALNLGGVFACTLKQGDGEEWSDAKLGQPRFFAYWRPKSLAEALRAAGFAEIVVTPTDNPAAKWLHAICKK